MTMHALKGAFLAEVVVALFMAILLLFALNAELQTGLDGPVRDTLALWPIMAVPALGAGLLVGAVAGRVERRRIAVLLLAAAIAYVAAAIAVVFWMAGGAPGDRGMALAVGGWAALAYGIFVVPLWTGAVIVLERWTRC
ncbi:MAG: hypothetical protein HYY06_01930 [Deltaproteobacteria bacterium]|nr:hypothetical protein [Deltaproteobacteria bacterium]